MKMAETSKSNHGLSQHQSQSQTAVVIDNFFTVEVQHSCHFLQVILKRLKQNQNGFERTKKMN